MKREMKLILIPLLLITCLSLSGCNKHNCEKDGHVYGEWIIDKESTCLDSGLKHQKCKYCDNIETEVIQAKNHSNQEWIIVEEPTCTSMGKQELTCKDCGAILETQSIDKIEHSFEDDICSVCGYNKSACAKGHKASDWIIDWVSTCTKEGQRHKECVRCGQVLNKEKTNKLDHTVGDWITDKEATCESGLKHQHCSVCNQDLNSTSIPPVTEHNYINYECTICHDKLDTSGWSRGLSIQNGIVCGIGTCHDKNIVIPSYMEDGTKVTSIGAYAFSFDSLTSVTIPNTVISIGYEAFYCCANLVSISIPNTVISIGNEAFYNCIGLTSITIPNSVTNIGDFAFTGCSSLSTITVEPNNKKYDSRNNCNAIIETNTNTLIVGFSNTIIPNSVKSIEHNAFAGCSNLTSITIPNSVIKIGDSAFFSCTGLESITIPNSVIKIGNRAFNNCTGLESITIPNSVTNIGDFAFVGCSSLSTIIVEPNNKVYDSRNNCNAIIETNTNTLIAGCSNTIIPNSVTSIERSAFNSCKNLSSITIPNSITSIGNRAFAFCSSLLSITIPNTITNIEDYTFCECSSLVSITIPISVTKFGEGAFSYIECDIIYQGTVEQWNSINKTLSCFANWNENSKLKIICTDGTINP